MNSNINNLSSEKDINFMSKNIGGSANIDTPIDFNNQYNLLANNSTDYERTIDYNNKIERDKNKNNNFVERLDNELHTTVYRINNYPTYTDDINISNPVIYPRGYDEYFEYLDKKNLNPINTQIVKTKNYVNIDSSNRNIETSFNVDRYINLENYSIEFQDSSAYFKIYIDNALQLFSPNDYIILRGFKNYSINYTELNFFFTNESNQVVMDLKKNFNIKIPYYDVYVKISNVTNGVSAYWKNIPLNLINDVHKVNISNSNSNDYRYFFELPINFYSINDSDKTLVSDCTIEFFSIGNYPINLINSDTPLTYSNLNDYLIIDQVYSNYIQIFLSNSMSINSNIQLDGIFNGNTFKTGTNIQIAKITGAILGYPNPNSYLINLDKNYNNICEIKLVSSEIPNVQTNINSTTLTNYQKKSSYNGQSNQNLYYLTKNNNKLYWQNILDLVTYEISLDTGYYSYSSLKNTIEQKASEIKRNLIFSNLNLYEYNILTVNFDTDSSLTKFNL